MGETDGLHQRRVSRWPKEATELVREYKQGTNRSQEHTEIGRRKLVTKLAAISGNPRDACLRFLRELGIHQKRAYREWTKPEQQRLLDLISSPAGGRGREHSAAVGGFRALDVAPARDGRKNGAGMVHQVLAVSRAAHPSRRDPKMD